MWTCVMSPQLPCRMISMYSDSSKLPDVLQAIMNRATPCDSWVVSGDEAWNRVCHCWLASVVRSWDNDDAKIVHIGCFAMPASCSVAARLAVGYLQFSSAKCSFQTLSVWSDQSIVGCSSSLDVLR